MKSFMFGILFISSFSFANKKVCFDGKKEMSLPNTKFTISEKGDINSGTQKVATLTIPKGFRADCLITAPVKADTLVVLSLDAVDYDEKGSFVFRISTKDSKIVWSQNTEKMVEPHFPFVNEKIVLIPTYGEVIAMNPDTGGIRWRFNREAEGVEFRKISILTNIIHAEGVRVPNSGDSNVKFEMYMNGVPVPPKKSAEPKAVEPRASDSKTLPQN